ncbi:tyrosine-type recombinase/integrase [uncultured Desulfuromonas sp.]|uniref:tyrosine-type recombinase/integrase n=1 Tax=uncultured Desulfuromonas sp. TaxID=181013 RepID=UPI002635C2FC|nr:tyrosine-type recombinase/integrase [uncultured Desulfuromonas sp.]
MTHPHHLKLAPHTEGNFTLPAEDTALLNEIIEGYKARRIGARRYNKKSVEGELAVVRDFINHSQMSPWHWGDSDFEAWCNEIGVNRKLAVSTQRKYQSAVKIFLDYLVNNQGLRNKVKELCGVAPRQICHRDNMIPHKLDRELARKKPALTEEQVKHLLDGIAEGIDLAWRFTSKALIPLQRDKALFSLVYGLGLRASEACNLDLEDFYPNSDLPQLGRFGFTRVTGKGSRGTGPKFRTVPIMYEWVAETLCWYIEEIRPRLLKHAAPNEKALFLSERGTRLTRSSLDNRFQEAVTLSGLDGLGFTPHCLRHSQISHAQDTGLSLEATRRMAGHAFASTTQGYTHVGDRAVQNEIAHRVNNPQRQQHHY